MPAGKRWFYLRADQSERAQILAGTALVSILLRQRKGHSHGLSRDARLITPVPACAEVTMNNSNPPLELSLS